jgi:hypothetical protein
MSKFVKLTKMLINEKYIQSIIIKPNKYFINLNSSKFYGSTWTIAAFGNGTISSYNSEIEVCETQNSDDYKILSEWIDKQK